MSPSAGENVAPAIPSSLSISGTRRLYVGGRQRLDLMAEFALERDMLDGARECVFVVEPEVALLAEADLVAHALVVFDRRTA